jgi:hypothetical protein
MRLLCAQYAVLKKSAQHRLIQKVCRNNLLTEPGPPLAGFFMADERCAKWMSVDLLAVNHFGWSKHATFSSICNAGVRKYGEAMSSGKYWISNNYIYGPKESGRFWISGGYIYGPRNSGKYWISGNYIYGPKHGGKFWISGGYIYGPSGLELPWLS